MRGSSELTFVMAAFSFSNASSISLRLSSSIAEDETDEDRTCEHGEAGASSAEGRPGNGELTLSTLLTDGTQQTQQ